MKKDIRTPELKAMLGFITIVIWFFLFKESWPELSGKTFNKVILIITSASALWLSIRAIYKVFKSPEKE